MIILLIILVVLCFGTAPTWGYSRGYGWRPFGIIGLVLLILLLYFLLSGMGFAGAHHHYLLR